MGSHDPMSHMIILWKMWFKVRVTKIHFPSGFSDLTGLLYLMADKKNVFRKPVWKQSWFVIAFDDISSTTLNNYRAAPDANSEPPLRPLTFNTEARHNSTTHMHLSTVLQSLEIWLSIHWLTRWSSRDLVKGKQLTQIHWSYHWDYRAETLSVWPIYKQHTPTY